MIYIMKTNEAGSFFSQDTTEKLLSEQRLEKMHSFYQVKDGLASALSYILLRAALYREYGINDRVEFVFGEYKKPYLKGYENIFFNLSHCSNAVMCAVSDCENGADIQDYNDMIGDCADMILHCSEKAILDSMAASDKELIRFWTMKEAYGKYIGKGILYELDTVSFSDVPCNIWQDIGGIHMYSECMSEYAYSVCSVHPIPFCRLSQQELLNICEKLSV